MQDMGKNKSLVYHKPVEITSGGFVNQKPITFFDKMSSVKSGSSVGNISKSKLKYTNIMYVEEVTL